MRRSFADERGATLVIIAVAMTAILIMVSLVIDLSLSRTDRRVNKSTADFAATAGAAEIPDGPWPAVCIAYEYLKTNAKGYSSFSTEEWRDGQGTVLADPCDPTSPEYGTLCTPDLASEDTPTYLPAASRANRVTWAWFHGTADGGRITVDIKSGYRLPGEETAWSDDANNADPGLNMGCDHIAIIVSETRSKGFSGIVGAGDRTTRIRSVARSNNLTLNEDVAALNLLERHECNVLQAGSAGGRVVALSNPPRPGIIQFDSAADSGSCPQPIINGQATTGGPSIVACSTNSSLAVCAPPDPGPAYVSRIGVYALALGAPAGDVARPFATGEYGDTPALPESARVGRAAADERYRVNVETLDANVQNAICATSAANCPTTRTIPQGCTPVVAGLCIAGSVTWRVVSGPQCNDPGASFAAATILETNVFFACSNLQIGSSGLTISAADAHVIVTGQLSVNGNITIPDPRHVWIGGTSSGPARGLDITGGTFTINRGTSTDCTARLTAARDKSTDLVVGKGRFRLATGPTAQMCQTFVYLANQYDRVPATDDTAPCTSVDNTAPCSTTSNYNGLIEIGSGSTIKWTAPNELAVRPTPADFLVHKFEDLALWTESAGSGGTINEINGRSDTEMAGVFFLPNANVFRLAGGGTLPINLNAQFWARKMQVTGGATVFLRPNPDDSITLFEFSSNLVR